MWRPNRLGYGIFRKGQTNIEIDEEICYDKGMNKIRGTGLKKRELFETSPVIAAIRDDAGLEHAGKTDCEVVFILYGTICSIGKIVDVVKSYGKLAIVHVDLVAGLSAKEVSVDFIKANTAADGIISTKPMLVKHAMEVGLIGGQRTFIIDSMALDNMKKQLSAFKPDFMEVMPGVMPKVLKTIREHTDILLVAGGLLSDKKDIIEAFDAGADAVSTTKETLWYV